MKIFKLKYLAMIITVSLLWSCQTESIVSEEVTSSIKKPLPDGIPSDADDVYEFAKSKYYHNGKLLTDTTEIKKLTSNARALHVQGNIKTIFFTEQEAAAFKSKSDALINANSKTAALDGDNYLHYFYESTIRARTGGDQVLRYCSVTGPLTYSFETSYVTISVFDQALSGTTYATPVFRTSYVTGDKVGRLRTIANLLDKNDLNTINNYYQINVVNTTRYTRRVVFVADSGVTVYADLAPNTTYTINGSVTYSSSISISPVYKFGAQTNFKVKSHYSNKL